MEVFRVHNYCLVSGNWMLMIMKQNYAKIYIMTPEEVIEILKEDN